MSRQQTASCWARRPMGVAGGAARGAPARSATNDADGPNRATTHATRRLESQVSIRLNFKTKGFMVRVPSVHTWVN